jgi:hypothetical protein
MCCVIGYPKERSRIPSGGENLGWIEHNWNRIMWQRIDRLRGSRKEVSASCLKQWMGKRRENEDGNYDSVEDLWKDWQQL